MTIDQLKVADQGPNSISVTKQQLVTLQTKVEAARQSALRAVRGQLGPGKGVVEGVDGPKRRSVPPPADGAEGDSQDGGLLPSLAAEPLAPVREAPAEGQEGLWAALRNWRFTTKWTEARSLSWHLMRALCSLCLMLAVMWMMGLFPGVCLPHALSRAHWSLAHLVWRVCMQSRSARATR